MALERRCEPDGDGLIHHSDSGGASTLSRDLLLNASLTFAVVQSFGSTGDC